MAANGCACGGPPPLATFGANGSQWEKSRDADEFIDAGENPKAVMHRLGPSRAVHGRGRRGLVCAR
jgi:hypothetical protein